MSRFVSGGTLSTPTDEASTSTQPAVNDSLSSERDAAWTQAQAAIDATRQAKKSDAGSGMQEGGKSLYETLQANKGILLQPSSFLSFGILFSFTPSLLPQGKSNIP